MARIRRTPYAFLYLEDDYVADVAALLRGELPAHAPEARLVALSILTGERYMLRHDDLELLLSVPAEQWVDEAWRDRETVRDLTRKGLLVSDADDDEAAVLLLRDEALSVSEWNLYAALYHFMTQWSGVDTTNGEADDARLAELTSEAGQAFAEEHGPAPAVFEDKRSGRTVQLPGADCDRALYRTLMARRTTRAFDTGTSMTIEELDIVLRYVFGCHGYAVGPGDVECMKRTSPSGGGLHPIEAYPIISNVTDVPSGIYHYTIGDHSLVLISELEPSEARQTATAFAGGQSYFGAANVSFVLTARFYRNHWKYRRHHKAYAGILMDAAHLSQTLYLVSGELGLGAYITIAINSRDIERHLGFDGINEGVIAMVGCGRRAGDQSPLELQFSAARAS